jgi:hypothetical protein
MTPLVPTQQPRAIAEAEADGKGNVSHGGAEEWAICCSGGGIRSASYCLGAMQRIEEDKLLSPDSPISMGNVSTIVGVSGGSYITASRALVANGIEAAAGEAAATPAYGPAYATGSPEEQHLRDNTNYLAPDAKTLLAGVLSLLFGVAVTLVLVLTPLFALAHAWGWLLRSRGVLTNGVAAHGHASQWTTGAAMTTWWIWPVIAAGVTFVVFLWWWVTLMPSRGGGEAHSMRAVSALGWAASITVALAIAMLAVPDLIAWLSGPHSGDLKTVLDDLGFGAGAAWTPAALVGFVAAVVAVAQSARTAVAKYDLLKAPAAGQTQSGLLGTVTGYLRSLVLPWVAAVLILLAGFVVVLRWVKDGAAAGFAAGQVWLFVAAVAVMLAGRVLADVNRISLHDFYRWRLATAYSVERDPASASGIKNVPGALLSRLSGQRPRPVLCATANVNARREVPVGRGALSFTFDPDHATLRGPGADEPLQVPITDYEALAGPSRFTLFDVSAISGAAFSPLMGAATMQAYRLLFTLTDLRLGIWLPHPAVLKAARAELDKQLGTQRTSGHRGDRWWHVLGMLFWYAMPHPLWRQRQDKLDQREARLWAYVLRLRTDGRKSRQFCGGQLYHALQPTLGMLYAEAAGHTHYRCTWICVTDGGHYDNLGLVETLNRGAQRILVLDASGDKANTWFTLGGAIAQARSDARTEIQLDPPEMCDPEHGLAAGQVVRPWVSGTFTRYPVSAPAQYGSILVCKLGWWVTAPWDVRAYAAGHPDYPSDSTLQQLYDDAEFDAYRELGWASVGVTIQDGQLSALITT